MIKLNEWINKKQTGIDRELFKNHFNFQRPSDMLKMVYQKNDKKKNNGLVNLIKGALNGLKKEIEKMSEDEKESEKSNEIIDIVEKFLEFNKQMQEGQGLKILPPNQMLSRLPISLAQLKAGNISEKLKSEIIQLLHSLYRSKTLTKNIYKSLGGTI